jgi:GR25 family glycosyltransferase involved in LPS biosynthesis
VRCYFDKLYCIHYPDPERKRFADEEFKKTGMEPQYVHAKRPMMGFTMSNMRRAPKFEFACNLSHIKAVAKSFNDKNPIFFEDDVVFGKAWKRRLDEAMSILPPDWDLLYMGGHPREEVERVAGDLYRVKTFSFAEAYAFNNGAQRRFHDFWCDEIGSDQAMYDFILGRFAAANNAYAIYPTITMQRICHSHIQNRNQDKSGLVLRGWSTNIKD